MAAFGAFAAGFVSRPLGGVLFGHIGDTMGRKTSQMLTRCIIAVGVCIVGPAADLATMRFWVPQAISPGGLLVAAGKFGLVSLLPRDVFLAWRWRVPLLASAPRCCASGCSCECASRRCRISVAPKSQRRRIAPVRNCYACIVVTSR